MGTKGLISMAAVMVVALSACAQSPQQVCQNRYGLSPGDTDYWNCVNAVAAQRRRASMAMISAGAGMMASPSPYPGVAVGQGGLMGLQTFGQ